MTASDISGYMVIYATLLSIVTCILVLSIDSDGIEFVNPVFLYKRYKVNWFGAFFLAIIFNLLIFPFAIIYWIYKLCTVGRE